MARISQQSERACPPPANGFGQHVEQSQRKHDAQTPAIARGARMRVRARMIVRVRGRMTMRLRLDALKVVSMCRLRPRHKNNFQGSTLKELSL